MIVEVAGAFVILCALVFFVAEWLFHKAVIRREKHLEEAKKEISEHVDRLSPDELVRESNTSHGVKDE